MGELRGGYRVHFGLAVALCGVDLLCMASTWLPGTYTVPKWLVVGLFLTLFPVFVGALFHGGGAARLLGRGNGNRLVRYIRLLPPAVKLGYALVIGACVLGFATAAGTAEDVRTDGSGYYYTYTDRSTQPQHVTRVALTEAAYYEALKSQLRMSSAGPALFYAFSSFLVLASASAAATDPGATAQGRSKQPG